MPKVQQHEFVFPAPQIFMAVPWGLCGGQIVILWSVREKHLPRPQLLRLLDAKPACVCRKLPTDSTKPWCCGDSWRGAGKRQPDCTPSLVPPPWPAHTLSLTAPLSTFAMQLTMIRALWFQVHIKLLDTKIPWDGGFQHPRPVTCLAPPCPAVLYFCPAMLYFCPGHAGTVLQQWRDNA